MIPSQNFRFQKGMGRKQVTADRLDAMRRDLISGQVLDVSGPGVTFTRGPDGVRIRVRQVSSTSTPPHAFKLQDVSASGELRVSLYTTTSTGFVNGIRPTIGGTAINVPNTYLVLTTTKEIVLRATRDFTTSPSTFACTVETYDVGSVPAEDVNADDWFSYLVLGRATIASGVMSLTDNDEWSDLAVENYGTANIWQPAPYAL
jgi:hypothetical protein